MGTHTFSATRELLDTLSQYVKADALQIVMQSRDTLMIYAIKNGKRLLEYGPISLDAGETVTLTGVTIEALNVSGIGAV